jgi:chromosome partitioning protein
MSDEHFGIVISVYNEKGGSGKTTTSCQLAGTLGRRGYEVLVADLDPQQTSSSWIARHSGEYFPATCWSGFRYGERVATELANLSKKYDIIVADCAPSVEQPATWGALLSSSLALIPTKLNATDMDALPAAKRLAKKAWDTLEGDRFPIRVVPNAAKLHFKDDRAALNTLLKDTEIPPTRTTLGDRKAYSRSMLIGSTVHDLPKSEESVREVEELADEVLKIVGLPAHKKGRARK